MNTKYITFLICLFFLTSCKETLEMDYSEEDIETTSNMKSDESIAEESVKEEKISFMERKKELTDKGFEVWEMVDEETQDTILMQKYFMAFLKSGPVRNQNEEESNRIQAEHMAHLSKMYEMGYADISGPFESGGDLRGITVYNVPTREMADSLANADPAVKAQRLVIEIHPWWAMKDAVLR